MRPSRPGQVVPAKLKADVTPVKWLKRALLRGVGSLGGFSLAKGSRWRARRLLVLGYHGISMHDEHRWDSELFMHPDQFARRMKAIHRNGYSVVRLEEGLAGLTAGSLPGASVSITFDDGLYCFYKTALPILESFGFPVTVYLTTFYTDFQEPVFDILCSYMLWKSRSKSLDLRSILGSERSFRLADHLQRHAASLTIQQYIAREHCTALDKVLLSERLASALAFDLDAVRKSRLLNLMTPKEVADACSRGVTVELHTHRHRVPMERTKFFAELDDNRLAIQNMTGRSPIHFCYPNGDYHATFEPWLRDLHVESAATCAPGLVSSRTPPMLLPRLMDTSALDLTEFEGWLSGVSAGLPKRIQQLFHSFPQRPTLLDNEPSARQPLFSPRL